MNENLLTSGQFKVDCSVEDYILYYSFCSPGVELQKAFRLLLQVLRWHRELLVNSQTSTGDSAGGVRNTGLTGFICSTRLK